jgi:hypothetical protein
MTEYNPQDDTYFGPLFESAVPKAKPEPELTNESMSMILARLKEGPATCRQIDRLTPARGQALVHSLRKMGFRIQTKLIDKQRCYVLKGHAPTIRRTKTMQERYYTTTHWKETAKLRKERDGYRCRQCGTGGTPENQLETHHWVYELFCEDIETELITFCLRCHQGIHEAIRGGACHFPDVVDEETALKLGWEPDE